MVLFPSLWSKIVIEIEFLPYNLRNTIYSYNSIIDFLLSLKLLVL